MTDFATLQQHRLLSQLLGLSRDQGRALTEQRLDDFLTMMDERERIMAGLVEIEQSPPPANVLPFPTIAAGVDADAKAAMLGLIRSILSQDEENERALREQMSDLRGAMERNHHARAAGRGYAAAVAPRRSGEWLDRAC